MFSWHVPFRSFRLLRYRRNKEIESRSASRKAARAALGPRSSQPSTRSWSRSLLRRYIPAASRAETLGAFALPEDLYGPLSHRRVGVVLGLLHDWPELRIAGEGLQRQEPDSRRWITERQVDEHVGRRFHA